MISKPLLLKNRSARNAAALFIVCTALSAASSSARAVTCEDVRALSSEEQDYWSKKLNISAEQRHRIWIACYRDYHPAKGQEIVRR